MAAFGRTPAHGRESMAAEIGQGADYGGGLLTFWKGRWFVSVLGYPETQAKRQVIYDLAGRIAALISEKGEPPAIVAALPKPGLIEASVRPFYSHLQQNDYRAISHENPLGIGEGTEAVLARYTRQVEHHILLMVDYATESEASKAQQKFNKTVLGGPSCRSCQDRDRADRIRDSLIQHTKKNGRA